MSTVSYTLGNSKPLINREQNYVLDRRLLSIHSVDRDITKYPNANFFEIVLPEPMYNVQSLRIVQTTFPGKYYVFSNNYQNTKFNFSTVNHSSTPMTLLPIQEGIYTPNQLASELTNKMNETMANAGNTDGSFNVFYNEVSMKYYIGNTDASFSLLFNQQVPYDVSCNNYSTNPVMWFQYANWGLPYNIGFNKAQYNSGSASSLNIDYLENCSCVATSGTSPNITQYVVAPLSAIIDGDTCIYMEVDKYNSYDEMYPYNKSSCHIYDNNAYNGKVNSAFAKIPIKGDVRDQDSRNVYLQNIVEYDPPIERIARLVFKFRFHDGRLVDFQNNNFDFTIEFNCLKNEILKRYTIRVPVTYQL